MFHHVLGSRAMLYSTCWLDRGIPTADAHPSATGSDDDPRNTAETGNPKVRSSSDLLVKFAHRYLRIE